MDQNNRLQKWVATSLDIARRRESFYIDPSLSETRMELNNNTAPQQNEEITFSVKFPVNFADVLEKFQATLLGKAMEKSGGNRTHAANFLGLNRTTLISKAKRHGVLPENQEGSATTGSTSGPFRK